MTEMRRMTVSIPDEMDRRLLALRRDDRFSRCSYSELVRRMLDRGMKDHESSESKASGGAS